jgi:hypothetical protein
MLQQKYLLVDLAEIWFLEINVKCHWLVHISVTKALL